MITTILFDIYGTLIDIVTDEADIQSYEALSKWLEYKYIYLSADQMKWLYHEEFVRRLGLEESRARAETDIFKNIINIGKMRTECGKIIFKRLLVADVYQNACQQMHI